jgi:hypothetical protein
MKRLAHGEILTVDGDDFTTPDYTTSPFGYMFRDLQRDDKNLLETSPATVNHLRQLGEAMTDPTEDVIPGVPVPAIHTFFGQFVDHDITLERGTESTRLEEPKPLLLDEIDKKIRNSRSPALDLDSVYGPDIDGLLSPRDPANPGKMLLGEVERGMGLPRGKDVWNDFPRGLCDGFPRIGDSRNDENIITLQIHVAFLRAHNAIVDRGYRFDEARKLLIQHYQWIVLDDFLERIADPTIVKMIRYRGGRFFNPPARSFFMPLEFSVAAYRFGHSKVRPAYDDFNDKQESGVLNNLFRPSRRLTDDWIIDWPSFLDPENPGRFPRPIDTSLTYALLHLTTPLPEGPKPEQNLAVRNLLRGYILRMPTGQAVARAMASQGIQPMTDKQIASVAMDISSHQLDVLEKAKFLTRTPLWFYILAEAAFYSRGHHLGPVGSTIVAEVLIAVLRKSTYSILSDSQWRPTLGDTLGKFDLEDLLKLAGVF